MRSFPRTAIIGAGPAGLILARMLHMGGMCPEVFERDPHAHYRAQGGTLDLHKETGHYALRAAGLEEAFRAIARYEDQGNRLYTSAGKLLFADDDAAEGDRPEVDRKALREMLLASLPAGTVRWGTALQELKRNDDGQVELTFEDGTTGVYDLVVGADGAWSKVRPHLSHYKPQYSGLTFIEFEISDADRLHPELAKIVGRGTAMIEGSGRSLIIQRNANAHLRGDAIFRVPLDWAEKRFSFSQPALVREELADEFRDWCAEFLGFFSATNDRFAARRIFALPVGHQWLNQSGLTLIGDAAHVMSPFGGHGANMAMRDAADLAANLLREANWQEGVRRFEQDMFERVSVPAAEAAEAAATYLSHLGAEATLVQMQHHLLEGAATDAKR